MTYSMSCTTYKFRGEMLLWGKMLQTLWYGYFGGGAALTFGLECVKRPTVAFPDPLVVVFRVGLSRQEQHRREGIRCAPVMGALTASSGREVAQRVGEEQGEGDVDRDEVHPGQGEIDGFDPVVVVVVVKV